jgi:hypothetical protein
MHYRTTPHHSSQQTLLSALQGYKDGKDKLFCTSAARRMGQGVERKGKQTLNSVPRESVRGV